MAFSFKPTQATDVQTEGSVKAYQPPIKETPLMVNRQAGVERGGIVQTFFLFIFIILIIVAIALFGYSYYLNIGVESKKAELAGYEAKIGQLPIGEMRSLSNRLKSISKLVKEHPSSRVAFMLLEDSVENPITYNSFNLAFSDSLKSYELKLEGTSPTYRALVEQIDTFKREPYNKFISTIDTGDISPDKTGEIKFSLTMPINIVGIMPEYLTLHEEETQDSQLEVASSTNP